jgi:DNA-binding winged helix-turn-helix (wHTH) protein
MSESSPQRFRFGFFEVDTRSGELRRQGSKVNLQEQPFQVLVLLLERPGQVVTRDELSKKLWPENTYVDSERGLNKAINKIRAALRDDAEKPCFIETLPQRGYRFIAPLKTWLKCAVVFGCKMLRRLSPWRCYRSTTCLEIPHRNTSPTA